MAGEDLEQRQQMRRRVVPKKGMQVLACTQRAFASEMALALPLEGNSEWG